MNLAQHIALGLARRTPLHSVLTGRFLAEHVARMLDVGFEPSPALDPRRDPPIPWLLRMRDALRSTRLSAPHEGFDILRGLLREEEPYEAQVPLRAAVGVLVSFNKGELDANDLPSLDEKLRARIKSIDRQPRPKLTAHVQATMVAPRRKQEAASVQAMIQRADARRDPAEQRAKKAKKAANPLVYDPNPKGETQP
jgi:hypothetical protein